MCDNKIATKLECVAIPSVIVVQYICAVCIMGFMLMQEQKQGHPTLQGLKHFGLKDLYEHLKIDTPYEGKTIL